MSRFLPYPALWAGLFAMWLLLSQSVEPGQLLLAAIVATLGCGGAAALQLPRGRRRPLVTVLRLLGRVLLDIAKSNLAVLRLIISGREPRSVFVTIPLELRHPDGLAILACIITATPGSAWVSHNSAASTVLVHVLDTGDGVAWGQAVKHDYESLLLEIFR